MIRLKSANCPHTNIKQISNKYQTNILLRSYEYEKDAGIEKRKFSPFNQSSSYLYQRDKTSSLEKGITLLKKPFTSFNFFQQYVWLFRHFFKVHQKAWVIPFFWSDSPTDFLEQGRRGGVWIVLTQHRAVIREMEITPQHLNLLITDDDIANAHKTLTEEIVTILQPFKKKEGKKHPPPKIIFLKYPCSRVS